MPIERACERCGSTFYTWPYMVRNGNGKYCSRSCQYASPEERFLDRVNKDGSNGCWGWTAGTSDKGYGQLRVSGKVVPAHRFSYELHNGPIPEGLCVCHRCDNRRCVNPDHLFLGTIADNNRDRDEKGRGRVPGFKGEAHAESKLTADNVRAIRAAYPNMTQTALAARYGVSKGLISMVVNRKRWKHIA